MSASDRSDRWRGDVLVGRAVWRPFGAALSLWAWFGWLTPWFAGLIPLGDPGRLPSASIFILGAALLGHASARLADRSDLPGPSAVLLRLAVLLAMLGAAWWTVAGDLAAVGLSTWQAAWIVMLAIGYPWWRAGCLSPSEVLDPEATLRRLFAGVLLAATAFVLLPRASSLGPAFLPIYVGGGLAGVALGQVADASRRRGGRPLPFGLSWYAGLLLGVVVVMVLGSLLAEVLTSGVAWVVAGSVARAAARGVRGLGSLLMPVLEALFRFIGPVFDAMIRWLQSWLEGAGEAELTIAQPMLPGAEEIGEAEAGNEILAQLGVLLRYLITILGAAALLWMAIRTTARARRPADDREVETLEPLPAGGSRPGETRLRAFLRSALGLPRRARGLYHAVLVRRVYAQLLEWAEAAGRPRRAAETPLEFGAALRALQPPLQEDLDEITQAYLRVRYGEAPEEPEMVNRVLAAWERVRHSEPGIPPPGGRNSR